MSLAIMLMWTMMISDNAVILTVFNRNPTKVVFRFENLGLNYCRFLLS